MSADPAALRSLPSVDQLVRRLAGDPALAGLPRARLTAAVREALDAERARARGQGMPPADADTLVARIADGIRRAGRFSLRPVINATGVVLHTNLGRALLSDLARERVAAVAAAYSNLEMDLASKERGSRYSHLEPLLRRLTGAEDALVVNNNAAAVLLALETLAHGKEVIVSRGELIEIGGEFRIPDIMLRSGAVLREVGATNRTHLRDYAEAIGPATGFLLKVHPSNYHVSGFTSSVGISELAKLAAPLVVDIGSGLLTPHPLLPDEPDATSVLRDGADLVTASGDKLLGGPQAGLLFGTAELIEKLRRHPAARALRVDKLTLAALEATLVGPPSPVALALDADVAELRGRAERMAAQLPEADAVDCIAAVGGGGAPGVELPSAAVSLPESYAAPLRTGSPAVVGRLEAGRCLLDLRTVAGADDELVVQAVRACTS